jgi:dTDP-3-amino-2,3,6-trideoxy-4-keto-D-glucose/dTDP-3-amino-3,4,6-trideoxy-alpha-D-glucose/dTDP-2,6-dideoxy-D-kanosamine transaminase
VTNAANAGFNTGCRVPVNDLARRTHALGERLTRAAAAVIGSGWYSLGPRVRAFESAFADYCGVEECIGVGNGTDALELALRVCGAGPGRHVVTVANAGGYSTTAILATGAEPVYADIYPGNMLVDTDRLPGVITADTVAVIATHLYGRMVDMPALLGTTGPRGVPVVEDCAQAHGARLEGRAAGAWGLAGCFSFYPTKNLGALGDGGAVVTHDARFAAALRSLRQYGWSDKYHNADAGGRNSRLDEIQAAFLLEQLPLLDDWNYRRRDIAGRYTSGLRDTGLSLPPPGGMEYVAHLYVIASQERDRIRQRLTERGIGTDVHYPVPDPRQSAWAQRSWAQVSLPEAEAAAARVLTIPCFAELTDAEVAVVIEAVRESARNGSDSM